MAIPDLRRSLRQVAHRFRWRVVAACRLTRADRTFAAGRQFDGS
jgi:hypothetical protein